LWSWRPPILLTEEKFKKKRVFEHSQKSTSIEMLKSITTFNFYGSKGRFKNSDGGGLVISWGSVIFHKNSGGSKYLGVADLARHSIPNNIYKST